MNTLIARNVVSASVLAAVLLILVMELLAAAGFFVVASIWHGVAGFAVTALIGFLIGCVFKDKIANAYPVAIFSLLFAYVSVKLVGFLGKTSVFLIYISLIILSILFFYLQYRFFRDVNKGMVFKTVFMICVLFVWSVLSSVLGLYLTRVTFSY